MRKILLLTLLTILGGASSVKARDVHATLASATTAGSATWTLTESVYTYTWTDAGESRNDYISLFNAFKTGEGTELDWSDGTNFIFTCDGPSSSETNALNVIIVANGSNFSRAMYSDGTKTLTLTATSGDGFRKDGWGSYITAEDLAHVTDIRLQATNKSGKTLTAGSVTVSNLFVQLSPKATLSFNASGVATIDLDDIDVSGDATYNNETNIVTSSGSGAFLINFDKADFRNVTKISLNAITSGTVSEIVLFDILGSTEVYDNINKSLVTWSYSKWNYDFTSYKSRASQVTYIKFNLNSGSMKINSITITADAMQLSNPNSLKVAATYATWDGVGSDANITKSKDPTWEIGRATGTVYGDVNVHYLNYADLKAFKTMKIYVNASSATIRAMFNRVSDGGDFYNVQVDPSSGTLTEPGYSSYADGVFTIDLAKILADKGTVHLNAIKASAGQSNAYVDKVILDPITPSPYNYVLSGQYSSATDISEFTSDASATAVDCSSLSGNNATITPSNPNCLFVARAGVLANPNNVIVDGTCAKLALSDGYPFQAPEDFTATAASYNRSFIADKMTTVCLPFALTNDEASTLGTFYELSSVDGTVITFSEVAAPAANTPYLVIPTRTTLSIGSKSIAATPAETKSSASNIEFIGTLAATEIPASEGPNNYYAFNNGVLVRIAENSATLPAFRAYIKATGDVGDVKAFTIQFDDATGVNSLPSMDVAASSKFNVQSSTIYNVAGQRMSKLQKGLNIVNGQKVMVK